MRWLLTLSILIQGSSAVLAEEIKLFDQAIIAVLTGQTLVGADDGNKIEQIFQKGGLTIYIDNGAQSQGEWKVEGDQYCSVWPPGSYWACYDVTRDGNFVTFISKSGKRTPMRLKKH